MKKLSVFIFLLAVASVVFLIPSRSEASGCTATTTGTWSTGSNWTGCSGSGGVPAVTDNVTINTGVTITLDTAPTVASLTVKGILDTSSTSNFAFTAGTLDLESGGQFKANTSTVTLTGSSGTIITTNGGSYSGNGPTFTGNGDVTIAAGTGTMSIGTINFNPTLTASHTYTLGTGLATVGGNITTNPTASSAATLTIMMSRNLSPFGVSLSSSGSASTVFDTSPSNYSLTIASGLSIGAGSTFNANASTITMTKTSGALVQSFIGTFNAGTSTFIMNGDGSLFPTGGTVHFYNLILSPTITANRTYTFGTTALAVTNNLTIDPTAASTLSLTVDLGAAATVTGTTLIEGSGSATAVLDTVSSSNYAFTTGAMDIESTGSFLAENAVITDQGNWTNHGTFTAGTSTVVFKSSTTATVIGPTTFYNFTINPTTAKEIDFSSNGSDIIAVTNIFSLRGSSGNVVKLRSNSAGNKWHFDPTGVATADWVDVQDGGLQPGAITISAADYTNSGNNDSGWTSVGSVPYGAIYYVDSVFGSDSNSGISPTLAWQSLNKVTNAALNPGDQVLFKRGGTFYGTLTIASSGTSAHPIIFDAYGSGTNPVITGLTTISSWTNLGSNIWESTNTVSTLSTANIVLVNGVDTPMGRFPNTGYLPYQSFSGSTAITSSSLTGTPNWTGATVVIRKNRWIIDQGTITSQSGGTLNYSSASSYGGQNGDGFFIQNDIRTLDSQNEWYYNPSTNKLDIYSTTAPTNVQISSQSNLVSMTYKNYLTFGDLSFTGANGAAFNILSSAGVTIQNSAIADSYNGISSQNDGQSSGNFILNNSTISNIHNNAVFLTSEFTNPTITNNVVSNVGIIPGAGGSGDGQYIGMYSQGSGTLMQYNEVDNSGYIPISLNADSSTINDNLVNNFCLIKDDGGGIYSYGIHTGDVISHNTVLNGVGNNQGLTTLFTPVSEANGIYIDGNESSGFSILNNTVANVGYMGIFLHNSHDASVQNNTVYNSALSGLYFDSDSSPAMHNLTVTNNIFFETDPSQLAVLAITSNNDVPNFGTVDNNYYIRPLDNGQIFKVYAAGDSGSSTLYDLPGWQAYSGFDSHSHTTPKTTSNSNDQSFVYNSTGSSSVVNLGGNYIDSTGAFYPGSITLAPYSSAALIKTTQTLATTYVISGPSSGLVNSTSTNFTVVPNGIYSGSITLTPSGGGLTSPIVLSFSNSQTSQTFMLTPTALGAVTLTPTNNGGLTNPSTIFYSAVNSSSGGGGVAGGTAVISTMPPVDCIGTTAFSASTGKACTNYVASVINPVVTIPSPGKTFAFTLNLQRGSKNIQVQWLQKYLNTHGYIVASKGAGSSGHETTLFGSATKIALSKFQKAHGILPASGYLGPLTRAYILSH